eukprot:6520-Heterococcus_DN1.PRE.1
MVTTSTNVFATTARATTATATQHFTTATVVRTTSASVGIQVVSFIVFPHSTALLTATTAATSAAVGFAFSTTSAVVIASMNTARRVKGVFALRCGIAMHSTQGTAEKSQALQ